MLPLSLTLTRDLVTVDVETTGTDVCNDAIWEIACTRYFPDVAAPKVLHLLIKPWKEVPMETQEAIGRVGINEQLQNCLPFQHYAPEIKEILSGCDYLGFNLRRFDLPIISEELHRCGIEWDPTQGAIIDSGTIFKIKEERTLTAAAMFYCGREHTDAHSALADTYATTEVLMGQLARYPDLAKMTVPELGKFSQHEDYVDLAGKFAKDSNGVICYTFGNTKGKPVAENPGMLEWMLNKSFTVDTKRWCRKLLAEIYPNRFRGDDGERNLL